MDTTAWHGIARKVVLPLIVLSGAGWLVYVIGFGSLYFHLEDRYAVSAAIPPNYAFYAAAVIGPFVYIGAIVHAALWRQISSIVGSVVAVLSVVYFTAMGFVLHYTGIAIYQHNNVNDTPTSVPTVFDKGSTIMFSGSFLACLFWAGALAMWPWYSTGAPTHGQLRSGETLMNEPLEEMNI